MEGLDNFLFFVAIPLAAGFFVGRLFLKILLASIMLLVLVVVAVKMLHVQPETIQTVSTLMKTTSVQVSAWIYDIIRPLGFCSLSFGLTIGIVTSVIRYRMVKLW
jgi:hypothetical protein